MTIKNNSLLPVALIASAFLFTPVAHAAGVVGTCDEPHLLAAVAGGGNVTFSCSGVITLSNPVPIQWPTNIDGAGVVTLSNGPGLLFVNCLGSCPLSLNNITLKNASDSAIYDVGQTVIVHNTTFLNNHARNGVPNAGGAIYCDNTSATNCLLDVSDSYFEGNSAFGGGAIYNPRLSYLVVHGSTFLFNSATQGGAIYNEGYLIVSNSTFTDNGLISGEGGNIYFAAGFGISEIFNSTLNAGRAPSGVAGNISARGASSQGSGSLIVANSIVANPGSLLSPFARNCSGPIIDGGGNLQWPPSIFSCVGGFGDPRLAPLAKNGGLTSTMALLPGSAAIDRGLDPICTLDDQRHILRPQGPHCDIGAYELVLNGRSPVGMLVTVLAQFELLVPKNGAVKLTQQVIGPLSRSLDNSLWQADGNHLNPQRGTQVFDLHGTVVNALAELIVDRTQLDYIQNLLFADRSITLVAMGDANCTNSNPAAPPKRGCVQAMSELAKGDSSSALGNYGEAVDHYAGAWSAVTGASRDE